MTDTIEVLFSEFMKALQNKNTQKLFKAVPKDQLRIEVESNSDKKLITKKRVKKEELK